MNRAGLLSACTGLVVLIGIGGRVAQFGQRPFWGDEAWVADAIQGHSYGQVLRQTDVPVPPLFAVTAKAFNCLAARPEVGLRLFPLICGIALLPTAWLVLRTLRVPRSITLVAMAVLASSTMLLVWSRELKQYEVEAFASMLLALLVFRLRRSKGSRSRAALAAGIVVLCVVAPWAGYGFVFAGTTLCGVLILLPAVRAGRATGKSTCATGSLSASAGEQSGATGSLTCATGSLSASANPGRHSARATRMIGLVALAAMGISTLAVLKVAASAQAGNPGLVAFTSNWYIHPFELKSWLRAAGYFCVTSSCLVLPQIMGEINETWMTLLIVGMVVIWLLIFVGLWTWVRSSRAEMCIYTLGPWVLLFLAALAGRYPFCSTRMMVMWAAPSLMAMSAGLVRVVRTMSILVLSRGAPGVVAAIVIALLPVAHLCAAHDQHALWVHHDFPRLLETIRHERVPEEPVIATTMASPAVRYYAPRQGLSVLCMPTTAGTCNVPGFSYDRFIRDSVGTAGRRVWVLTVGVPERTYRELILTLKAAGYTVKLHEEDTRPSAWGAAQLYRADRQ